VRKDAAMIVKDGEAVDKLMEVALKLLYDPEKIQQMETNIGKLAKMDAGSVIVDEAYKLI
jgi:UDP-N-acetylglucosamine--N-acetylmuramyl-(pentapeptide) pyrophosphoryl-undecaprenol N-acetylglucosamine transferase